MIVCRRCRTPLSRVLKPSDAALLERARAGLSLPPGVLVIDPEPLVHTVDQWDGRRWLHKRVELCCPGSLVARPDDLVTVSLHEIGATFGCCGLNGSDGENQACAGCGLVVGRLWTECWTQHEMRFDPGAVEVVASSG
jgi:hypothetical protein